MDTALEVPETLLADDPATVKFLQQLVIFSERDAWAQDTLNEGASGAVSLEDLVLEPRPQHDDCGGFIVVNDAAARAYVANIAGRNPRSCEFETLARALDVFSERTVIELCAQHDLLPACMRQLKKLWTQTGPGSDDSLDGLTGAMINVAFLDQSTAGPQFVDAVARHLVPQLIAYCQATAKQFTKNDNLSRSRVQSISSTVRTLTLIIQNLYPGERPVDGIASPHRAQTMRPLGNLKFMQSLVHLIPISRSVYCQLDIVECCVNLCKRDAGTAKSRLMQALGQNRSFKKEVGDQFKELLALEAANMREPLTEFVRKLHTDCMPAELRIHIFDVTVTVPAATDSSSYDANFDATAMMTESSLLVSNGLLSPDAESKDQTYAMCDITAITLVENDCLLVVQHTDPDSYETDEIHLMFHNTHTCLLAARYLSSNCPSLPDWQSKTVGARPPSTSPSFRAFGSSSSKRLPLKIDVIASTTSHQREVAPADVAKPVERTVEKDWQRRSKAVTFGDEVEEVTSMSLGDFSEDQEKFVEEQDQEMIDAAENDADLTQSWTPNEITVTHDGQQIDSMTCQKLRAELLQLGASTKGRKTELQQRIREILCDKANEAEQKRSVQPTQDEQRQEDIAAVGTMDQRHDEATDAEDFVQDAIDSEEGKSVEEDLQQQQHAEETKQQQEMEALNRNQGQDVDNLQRSLHNSAAVSQMRALLSSLSPPKAQHEMEGAKQAGEEQPGEVEMMVMGKQGETREIAGEQEDEIPTEKSILPFSKRDSKPKSRHAVFGALEDTSSDSESDVAASQQAWKPQKKSKKGTASPLVRRHKTTRAAAKIASVQVLAEEILNLDGMDEIEEHQKAAEAEQESDSSESESESDADAADAVDFMAHKVNDDSLDSCSSDEQEDIDVDDDDNESSDEDSQEVNSGGMSPIENTVRQLAFPSDESSDDDEDGDSDDDPVSDEDDDIVRKVDSEIIRGDSYSLTSDADTIDQIKAIGRKHQKKQQGDALLCLDNVSQHLDSAAKNELSRIKKLRKQVIVPIEKCIQKGSKKLIAGQVALDSAYKAYEKAYTVEMATLRQETAAASALRAELSANQPSKNSTCDFETMLTTEHSKLFAICRSIVCKTPKQGDDFMAKMVAMFSADK